MPGLVRIRDGQSKGIWRVKAVASSSAWSVLFWPGSPICLACPAVFGLEVVADGDEAGHEEQ